MNFITRFFAERKAACDSIRRRRASVAALRVAEREERDSLRKMVDKHAKLSRQESPKIDLRSTVDAIVRYSDALASSEQGSPERSHLHWCYKFLSFEYAGIMAKLTQHSRAKRENHAEVVAALGEALKALKRIPAEATFKKPGARYQLEVEILHATQAYEKAKAL